MSERVPKEATTRKSRNLGIAFVDFLSAPTHLALRVAKTLVKIGSCHAGRSSNAALSESLGEWLSPASSTAFLDILRLSVP